MSNKESGEQEWRLLPLGLGRARKSLPLPEGLVEAYDLRSRKTHVRLSSVLMVQSFNEEAGGNPCVRVFLSGVDEPVELQGSIDGMDAMAWHD